MRRVLLLLAVTVLFAAQALALSPTSLMIELEVDKDGSAHIVETYKIRFDSREEINLFQQEAKENGSSLLSWKVDEPWFFPHFSDDRSISRSFVFFDEGLNQISLDYFVAGQFATLVEDASRETKWKISDQQLKFFSKGGLLIIPENVTIKIGLPTGALLAADQLSSKVKVEGNTILLNGISTNYVNIQYSIPKPIAPLNIFRVIGGLLSTHFFLVFAVALLAGVVIVYKRQQIVKRIESYIIEHSEIEAKEQEEELDLDE